MRIVPVLGVSEVLAGLKWSVTGYAQDSQPEMIRSDLRRSNRSKNEAGVGW